MYLEIGSKVQNFLSWYTGRLAIYFAAFVLYAISIKMDELTQYNYYGPNIVSFWELARGSMNGEVWTDGYKLTSRITWLLSYTLMLLNVLAGAFTASIPISNRIIQNSSAFASDLKIYWLQVLVFLPFFALFQFELMLFANMGSVFVSGFAGSLEW